MKVLTINQVKINRPVVEVYQFVVNMENFKRWFPEVIKIKSTNDLAHGVVGKEYLETVKVPFKNEQKIVLKVVDAIENKLFITEGDFHPLFPQMRVDFVSNASDSTTVSWQMQSRNNNLSFKLILFPIFKVIMRKRAKIGVENLKLFLEQTTRTE